MRGILKFIHVRTQCILDFISFLHLKVQIFNNTLDFISILHLKLNSLKFKFRANIVTPVTKHGI